MQLSETLRKSGVFPRGLLLPPSKKGRQNLPFYFRFLTDECAARNAAALLVRGAGEHLQIDLCRLLVDFGTPKQAAVALASGKITIKSVQYSLANKISGEGSAEDAKSVLAKADPENYYATELLRKKAGESASSH